MAGAVRTLMEEKKSIWTDYKPIAKAIVDLDGIIDEIAKAAERQAAANGAVEAKMAALADLELDALEVAGAVCSWATENRKTDIAPQADIAPSELTKGRPDEIGARCENIAKLAEQNLAALVDHEITAATIQNLRDKIKAFKDGASKPRAQRSESSAATAALKRLFDDLDTVFDNRLDKLMVRYKSRDSEFYAAYFVARTIVDIPGGRAGSASIPAPAPAPAAVHA